MLQSRVLVVDDEHGMLNVCRETLEKLPGVEVITESDGSKALQRVTEENVDLLITDIRMPGINGIELLRAVRASDPDLMVLMLTAYPTVESAIESMKLGAVDYLIKPFHPRDLLKHVGNMVNQKRLQDENRFLARQVQRLHYFGQIIGQSQGIQALRDTITRVAANDADVLILGETGTGKELVARAIHQQSNRQAGRFVPVDCGAIPEDLLESEFFGHERGAFTGANERSLGLLEFANKGTFFLDEIGELPVRLQAKLLRALQERRIRRVGGTHEFELDVRVIAATSRNLGAEVRAQHFRMDLFYRINVIRIVLPPLRERGDDTVTLTKHLLERYCQEMEIAPVSVDPDVYEILKNYPWPGNVRELQNLLKQTLTMAQRAGRISVTDLPDYIVMADGDTQTGASTAGFFGMREQHRAEFEKEYFTALLRDCRGDTVVAAKKAQMPRGTLYRLLKKYNLSPQDFKGRLSD